MKAPDHIQAEGRTWLQKVQQWTLWWSCQITYKLRTQHSHNRLSSRFAAKGQHYIHSEGGASSQQCQQVVLCCRHQMTYILRAKQGHKSSVHNFAVKGTYWESQYMVLRSLPITYPLYLEKDCETFSLPVTLEDHLHPMWEHRRISILPLTHVTTQHTFWGKLVVQINHGVAS